MREDCTYAVAHPCHRGYVLAEDSCVGRRDSVGGLGGKRDGVLALLPTAKVGHIGLYRDPETLKPVEYYCKLPSDIEEREVIVIDPMLATGGSAIDAISLIKERGAKAIKFMCIIAVPEGIKALCEAHPDVQVYCATEDECLNEHCYIVPGLGDAGDRIFGTK